MVRTQYDSTVMLGPRELGVGAQLRRDTGRLPGGRHA